MGPLVARMQLALFKHQASAKKRPPPPPRRGRRNTTMASSASTSTQAPANDNTETPDEGQEPAHQPTSFLSLPPEIRYAIYDLVLRLPPDISGPMRPLPGSSLSILSACRQIRYEVCSLYYARPTGFVFTYFPQRASQLSPRDCAANVSSWLTHVANPWAGGLVRSITIPMPDLLSGNGRGIYIWTDYNRPTWGRDVFRWDTFWSQCADACPNLEVLELRVLVLMVSRLGRADGEKRYVMSALDGLKEAFGIGENGQEEGGGEGEKQQQKLQTVRFTDLPGKKRFLWQASQKLGIRVEEVTWIDGEDLVVREVAKPGQGEEPLDEGEEEENPWWPR